MLGELTHPAVALVGAVGAIPRAVALLLGAEPALPRPARVVRTARPDGCHLWCYKKQSDRMCTNHVLWSVLGRDINLCDFTCPTLTGTD